MTPPLAALSLDVSAVPPRPGGAGYYTMALASGLVARDDVALTLISRRDDEARWAELAPAAQVCAAVPAAGPGGSRSNRLDSRRCCAPRASPSITGRTTPCRAERRCPAR